MVKMHRLLVNVNLTCPQARRYRQWQGDEDRTSVCESLISAIGKVVCDVHIGFGGLPTSLWAAKMYLQVAAGFQSRSD